MGGLFWHPVVLLLAWKIWASRRLTPELQASELERDEAVADLNDVYESIEVVWGQDETVSRAVVSPAAQQKVPAQGVLQGARQVFIEDRVQVIVISTYSREKRKRQDTIRRTGNGL